ncbi:GNAT family N-acetyltransferase [Bacillus sp. 31A1R]|uniref:GNAT family N-acetyltransferase n=1 Tax=Robertmurraya mangrovi TaxID=3098077 RepID=A0ABU5ITJ1_9BACI|nr:GNAT family N-acetyltransferase [Bacillus sp. 31A1R]MDZ5470448.1 GNAT family N-acetyltransferase [Bacillus sp. 31A1R]
MEVIKGFKDNEKLRKSFNELSTTTFGINFESWYQKGYWTEKYEPFSIVDGNQVVANVSVNHIDLIIAGEILRGLQIGTVMTHPDFRNKGLSRKLMNHVLEEFEGQYDVMYLFANQTVLDFYPKFGFKALPEYQYSMDLPLDSLVYSNVRKLDDLNKIYDFSKNRIPVSKVLGTENTQELLMFYCMYVFTEDIYYIEELDTIVIYRANDEELHLFDVMSQSKAEITEVLKRIVNEETRRVVFHYTPDKENINLKREQVVDGDVLFVKTKDGISFPEFFKHPITAQA